MIEANTMQTAEPVIVEAPRPAEKKELPVIRVGLGVGAKEIDAKVNEFGIEQKNMEYLEEISAERSVDDWWLAPNEKYGVWFNQFKADISLDQKLKARLFGTLLGEQTLLEAGGFQDNRNVPYLDNKLTPYDSSDDTIGSFSNHREGSYAKIKLSGTSWGTLADFDQRVEDTHAGSVLTGIKSHSRESLNGQFKMGIFEASPFVQFRTDHFESQINSLYSNSTQGIREGLQAKATLSPLVLVESTLTSEGLARTFSDHSSTQFNRYYGKLLTQVAWLTNPWVEITWHGFLEGAQDSIDASQSPEATSDHPNEVDFLWDSGVDLSSSHRYDFGFDTKLRRYAILPTPTQKFGDGALLQGSQGISPETGLRFSAGPWWMNSKVDLGLSFFAEQATQAPIMVAVSPTSARTLPIGGIWTRGIELHGSLKVGRVTVSPSYAFQDSVNDSQINWQQGQKVPGRPDWALATEAKYEHRGVKIGFTHKYLSEDALDLGGLWFRPAQNQIGAFVGYGKKDWEVRVAGNNLISNWNIPQTSQFQGTAAPNLLEPSIEITEVRLQCEILM